MAPTPISSLPVCRHPRFSPNLQKLCGETYQLQVTTGTVCGKNCISLPCHQVTCLEHGRKGILQAQSHLPLVW